MISACETQEFVPFGRRYIENHPGIFQIQVQNHVGTEQGIPLVKSFRDISITDLKRPKEQWMFKKQSKLFSKENEHCDEELYVNGNTVIWSHGGQSGIQQVFKTFTMDTPVLQALWFDFILPNTEIVPDPPSSLDIEGELQTGICVVELGCVSCYCQSGKEYSMALPFQIASVWKMKNGLLFERAVSTAESSNSKRNFPNQTTVFSMLHCLDEVSPVIMRTNTSSGLKVSYMTDTFQHIVYTSVEPSLALIYDSQLGVHSAWRIQRAKIDDCSLVCGTLDNSLYHPTPGTPLNNQSSCSSRYFGNLSSQSPSVSPLRNFSGRISSPGCLHLPQPISPMISSIAASRTQSPAVTSGSLHRFHTPSPSLGRHSGNYFRTPPVCSNNVSLINESFTDWVEPLKPEVCLEHLWTEPAPAIRDGSLGKSAKVFQMRDLCGQQYLCYLITYRQQLRCVKFEESNDLSHLIFGSVSIIPAKDALPIESLNLLVILDPNGVLFIYSGVTKLNRLHVSTLPLESGSLSMLKPVTPMSSPQRGGIFTSSRPPSAMDQAGFDEEITRLSPVQTDLEDSSHFDEFQAHPSYIQGLRDNVGSRFTIELMNGSMCRAVMPKSSLSPGIEKSLQSLKHMLPKDLAVSVLGKWYTTRNAPGGLGNQSEWTLFTKTLFGLMGYDTSRLALTSQEDLDISASPAIVAKKPKQSDQGSEVDWEALTCSDHHKFIKSSIEGCFGFDCSSTSVQVSKHSFPSSLNISSLLFVHIPAVFAALHLIFEELLLSTNLVEEVENLVPSLYQLAVDLRKTNYADYYCRMFPSLRYSCSDEPSQITDEHLTKLQYPGIVFDQLVSVDHWINVALKGGECRPFPYIPGVCNLTKSIISLYAVLVKQNMTTEQAADRCLRRLAPSGHRGPITDLSLSRSFSVTVPTTSVQERMVLFMTDLGMTLEELECLPIGLSLPFREAIFHCRYNPPSDWPEEPFVLIGRQDLAKLLSLGKKKKVCPPGIYTSKLYPGTEGSQYEEDGMEHLDQELLRLRFSEDLRVSEARRLLQSSRPARIALTQRPEVSDHDFIEEQERHLYNICIRTMALPVGRHFFTETVLGISIPTLTRAKRAIQENRYDLNVRTPRVGTNGVRGRICEGFIAAYMNAACDRDPTGNIFRMPAGLTKLDLHSLYQTIHKDGIGKSKFYNILDSKYRNLVFCKNQRFTKCSDCHNFRCLIEKEQDTQIKSEYIAMRNLHLKEQQMEREAYYVRRGQAEMRQKEILSLIIDGMDQNKTDLPHYCKWSNPSGAGQQKLRTHIPGSIVHGRGKYFFIDHGQNPHDTNLSLSCLMKILSNESHNGILPPTLYVQLDNTARVQKDGTGHVYVQYKKLSTEDQWHPTSDERPLEIFKLDDVGCQMTPPGIPNQVHPYMAEEDIQTLKRGMFTLCTYHPLPTEPLPIPKLCLQGRAPPRNATVDLTHIDTPANMSSWPQFHNGVAAGLRMADFSHIDSTWILYNKPKGNELTNEYAGFLMALGLNEHLIHLHSLNVHDYLSKGSEMTTVGLLLGLAAAKRGTMDFATTRILSIHVAAFLPPTSTELNVPHNVQVAAILGVGLVYQGTAHRHTSEVLLSEIGRPPGPELDNCTDRESYSLAAGLALGLVMFGKGNEVIGTSDLGMADTLCHFMTGGHKRPLIGSNKERYKAPSYQIKEGDNINVDVTSPGATLALGMLYFRTNNSAVIDWLRVPDTQFMLDQVRPDFLMLRTISRGLVSWDFVVPSFEWIKSMIPQILQEKAFERKQGEEDDVMIDYETMSQSYCNVVAGGCLVIGLKFAGTANQMAFGTLMKSIKLALTIMSSQSHVEQTGRGVLENCMVTILLSLAMVMAGSGNLEVLRLCRMLRARIGPPHNIFVTYGSHMAISMAVGLLFLGGGRYSLSTTPEAIGIMLCAFFPKFPFHSNDNRYHLQAFRHLYVLATEARVVLPRDVDSGEPCYVPLEIKFKDTEDYSGEVFRTSAPTLLPELYKIEEVKILGPRYWPITFHIDKNWSTLRLLLKKNGILYVKQRAGYLSYVLDPKGYRNVLAKSLTSDHSSHTSVQPGVIKAFTTDPVISSMADYFLIGKDDCQRNRILQKLSSILYSCVTQEKPEMIPTHLRLDQILNQSNFSSTHLGIRQLKNILAYYSSPFNLGKLENVSSTQLLQMEFLLALKSQLEDRLDKWQAANMEGIVKYLQTNAVESCDLAMLSAYVTWYDIPTPEEISKIIVEGGPTLPVLCSTLPHLPVNTVMQILAAWQAAV